MKAYAIVRNLLKGAKMRTCRILVGFQFCLFSSSSCRKLLFEIAETARCRLSFPFCCVLVALPFSFFQILRTDWTVCTRQLLSSFLCKTHTALSSNENLKGKSQRKVPVIESPVQNLDP